MLNKTATVKHRGYYETQLVLTMLSNITKKINRNRWPFQCWIDADSILSSYL